MTTKALVAYASKHGSTVEIAEAIGATLRDAGVPVDVRPARDVRHLDGYSAIVIGSAVYMNKWQGDAIDFLKRFERDLLARPTWLFSSGPTGGTPDADAKVVEILASQPAPPGEAGRRAERIGARGHVVFGGRTGDTMTGLLERWLPHGDWRDFERIRTWADTVAVAIEPAGAKG